MQHGRLFWTYSTARDDQRAKARVRHFIDADGFECVAYLVLRRGAKPYRRVVFEYQYAQIKARQAARMAAIIRARKAFDATPRNVALNWIHPQPQEQHHDHEQIRQGSTG